MKFLSKRALGALKFEEQVFNARLKRGEIEKPEQIVRLHLIHCGCGNETCCFMSVERKDK